MALIGVFPANRHRCPNAILIIDFALDAEQGSSATNQRRRARSTLLASPHLDDHLAAGLGAAAAGHRFRLASALRQPLA